MNHTNKQSNQANILLIGCGPFAKSSYLPLLHFLSKENNATQLKAVVELHSTAHATIDAAKDKFPDAEFLFVKPFLTTLQLPKSIIQKLDGIVAKHMINGVIIATDPLNHMQYALWALKNKLHILMNKPISTRENVANSVSQAKDLIKDYELLIKHQNQKKSFIINCSRRYGSGFKLVQERVNEIAEKFKLPITGMQSSYCDGRWRLPNEILTQTYHPYIGWGILSHGGYHIIDYTSLLTRNSFKRAGKKFDNISTFSSFIRPSGLLRQQTQEDYNQIFGGAYTELDPRDNKMLAKLYQEHNEAEVDCASLIKLSNEGVPVTNISLNLLHSGFSRRSWILPNKDLYKGNGQVKHEYYNINQGPLQNIQIHCYHKSDKYETDNVKHDVGGKNHFDIYVFRNSDITGGQPLEIINYKDISKAYDSSSARSDEENIMREFIETVYEVRAPKDVASGIEDHKISVELMSMIYQSGIQNTEIHLQALL